MKRFLLIITFGFILITFFDGCKSNQSNTILSGVIPKPIDVKLETGKFTLNNKTIILISENNSELEKIALYLKKKIKLYTDINPIIKKDNKENKKTIILSIDKSNKNIPINDEAYLLKINNNSIIINARAGSGLFYGVQTLVSLLPVPDKSKKDIATDIKLSAMTIKDYPRYKWRGMMLDTCRHFMPPEFIKKFIDYLAMHKMNKFHWHLSEDQGWRIEISKYPKLTEISAFRDETLIGHDEDKPHKFDGKRHGGFYSKKEIKEIVEYAKDRYITIIPEIEMPGHSGAAIAAYPELSCTGGPFKVQTTWGVFDDVYCAGKESTFTFLEDVLSEVIELFPSKYIHIGGDECPKTRWKECQYCQARMKKEGLKDEKELQSYFTKRIEKFLNSKGKKLIGWDEILDGGIAPEATVMSWRGVKGGIEAAKQGHDVIMSPTDYCYFDYYQAPKEKEPLAIGGYLPLKKVYSFEPTPKELSDKEKKHILGGQANLWTEYIETPKKAEYMLFPRMAAMAEVLWSSKKQRNWQSFKSRLKKQVKRYDFLGINYSKNGYNL